MCAIVFSCLSAAVITKFDKSTLLDTVPLLSSWAIVTNIGASAMLDAVADHEATRRQEWATKQYFPCLSEPL